MSIGIWAVQFLPLAEPPSGASWLFKAKSYVMDALRKHL